MRLVLLRSFNPCSLPSPLKHSITATAFSHAGITWRQSIGRFSSSTSSSSPSSKEKDAKTDNASESPFQKAKDAFFFFKHSDNNSSSSKWSPIPISLGIAFIGAIHLYRTQSKTTEETNAIRPHDDPDLVIEGPWMIRLYASLPLREISRLWGYMNNLTVPTWLRSTLYTTYSNAFGCNLDEMKEEDISSFRNLGEFFYRELKDGARPIDASSLLVSPSDGKILSFGTITPDRKISQIKGISYSLDTLLGRDKYKYVTDEDQTVNQSAVIKKKKEVCDPQGREAPGTPRRKLFQCVIYLAPGDYHRFHSPAEWVVDTRRHFAGELLSVSPWIVEKIRNLFVLNERVTLTGRWEHGFFAMIPVGATNVGNICINFDPELQTNIPKDTSSVVHPLGTFTEKHFAKGITLRKGDEVGGFKLGSTIVLVFEAPDNFAFGVEPGQTVRVGESLGRVKK